MTRHRSSGVADRGPESGPSGAVGARPLFPLSVRREKVSRRLGLSRRCRQRADRRQRLVEDTADAMDALNWCSSQAVGPVVAAQQIHDDVHGRISQFVVERGCPDSHQSEEAAARELLRTKAGYCEGASTVEVFRRGAVALPLCVEEAPRLVSVLPEADRATLEDFESHMLRDGSEMMEMHDYGGVVHPYMDESFRNSTALYQEFVADLFSRGLVAFTRRVRSMTALFFVTKKGGRQRMIVDARPSNKLFKPPPCVFLAGPESFAALEVAGKPTLWQATADVENCFYNFKMERALGKCFCLPAVPANLCGITHLDGQILMGNAKLYPYLTVLPMGFSWAVWLAQRVNQKMAMEGVPRGLEVVEFGPKPVVLGLDSEVAIYVYADIIGVIGIDKQKVDDTLTAITQHFVAEGIPCKEESKASDVCEALGVEFNASRRCFQPTQKRYWQLRSTLGWVLRQRRISGRELEALLGHCTYFSMLERCLLSVWSSCYRFIRRHYWTRVPLGETALQELRGNCQRRESDCGCGLFAAQVLCKGRLDPAESQESDARLEAFGAAALSNSLSATLSRELQLCLRSVESSPWPFSAYCVPRHILVQVQ